MMTDAARKANLSTRSRTVPVEDRLFSGDHCAEWDESCARWSED